MSFILFYIPEPPDPTDLFINIFTGETEGERNVVEQHIFPPKSPGSEASQLPRGQRRAREQLVKNAGEFMELV